MNYGTINIIKITVYICLLTVYNVLIESATSQKVNIMNNLKAFANVDQEEISRDDLCAIAGCENRDLRSAVEKAVLSCTDLDILRAMVSTHDGYEYMSMNVDDYLEEMLGDEYGDILDSL
jgi:hypothetical protein